MWKCILISLKTTLDICIKVRFTRNKVRVGISYANWGTKLCERYISYIFQNFLKCEVWWKLICIMVLCNISEGKEVLFDGGTVSCQCFSSVVNRNSAQPVPTTIIFSDDSQLDHILTNIILVCYLSYCFSFAPCSFLVIKSHTISFLAYLCYLQKVSLCTTKIIIQFMVEECMFCAYFLSVISCFPCNVLTTL